MRAATTVCDMPASLAFGCQGPQSRDVGLPLHKLREFRVVGGALTDDSSRKSGFVTCVSDHGIASMRSYL